MGYKWVTKDRNKAASGDRAGGKAELRACGATNLSKLEFRITHHGPGIRIPFGPAPIKLEGSS